METKKCKGCEAVKQIVEFYPHPATRDGYNSKCKDCMKEEARARRQRRVEYFREYDRQRSQTPERKEYARKRRLYAAARRQQENGGTK